LYKLINNTHKKNKMLKLNNEFKAHQGDVQIFSIAEIPVDAKRVEKNFFAKSEKSGHCHALCGDYEMYELSDNKGFIVEVGNDGCTLNHTSLQNLTKEYWDKNQITEIADHKPTIIGKGKYFIGIQKRKKHFSKVWEKVKD